MRMQPQIPINQLRQLQSRMAQLVNQGYTVTIKRAATDKTALFMLEEGNASVGFILEARREERVIQAYRHPTQGTVYIYCNNDKSCDDARSLLQLHGQ